VADAPREYRITWATFDNGSNTASAHGGPVTVTAASAVMPSSLAASGSEFVRAEVASIHDRFNAWAQPVRVTFRRQGNGWKTVGLERLPFTAARGQRNTSR
jgi:hypothetical protein